MPSGYSNHCTRCCNYFFGAYAQYVCTRCLMLMEQFEYDPPPMVLSGEVLVPDAAAGEYTVYGPGGRIVSKGKMIRVYTAPETVQPDVILKQEATKSE